MRKIRSYYIGLLASIFASSLGAEINPNNSIIEAQINALDRRVKSKIDEPLDSWPEKFFHVSLKLSRPVSSKEMHLKILETIPEDFYDSYRIGKTIESEKWYITSLDPRNVESEESVWIIVFATRKNQNRAYVNSVW